MVVSQPDFHCGGRTQNMKIASSALKVYHSTCPSWQSIYQHYAATTLYFVTKSGSYYYVTQSWTRTLWENIISANLSSSRTEMKDELKSLDLIDRSQRSASLSISVIFSVGDKPPFDGCSSFAISSSSSYHTTHLVIQITKHRSIPSQIEISSRMEHIHWIQICKKPELYSKCLIIYIKMV